MLRIAHGGMAARINTKKRDVLVCLTSSLNPKPQALNPEPYNP